MDAQKFGRYEIKGEIGRGGMATVYHAYDPRFEREVAIKVLPREMLHEVQFRTRFEREAKTIAMLEHPAIVPVYDFGEEDGQPYFVMRYMPGGSLADRMKKGPMTVQDVAHLFSKIAPALDDAHNKGVIHRDLKPGNILFDQFSEPYISDFGIAKLTKSQTNFTGSAIVGTPAYMSPEQAQGESIDGRSDIYALGVILFELLSGQQPYHGDTPMSVVVKHITDPVPHILDVKPDLPPEIETIIEKSMAKDRNERFQDVKSLADALNSVANGESPNLETPKTATAATRPFQSSPGIANAKTAKMPPIVAPVQDAGTPPRKTGLWVGLGVAFVVLIIAVVAGVVLFKNKIPFLAAPLPTQTQFAIPPSQTPLALLPTPTTAVVALPVASGTPALNTLAPRPTATVASLPTLGGADLIAFLSGNDIWLVNVDGTNAHQLTHDGAVKHGMQWSPDGNSLFYISGKCVQNVTVPGGVVSTVTCFNAADFLDAFEISPDGTQVAISLNRVLFIVPFDLVKISAATTRIQLENMKGIFTYTTLPNQAPVKSVRWSSDGKKIAADVLTPHNGQDLDVIVIYDLSGCTSASPCNSAMFYKDNFPAGRFTMIGYGTGSGQSSIIPFFDWDGNSLFLLNSIIRNGVYGYLYYYNTSSQTGGQIDPIGGQCCYTSARFSPDGTYVLFSYQELSLGSASRNFLYYIPYGSIGTGEKYTPLPLPDTVLTNILDRPDPTLRPAK